MCLVCFLNFLIVVLSFDWEIENMIFIISGEEILLILFGVMVLKVEIWLFWFLIFCFNCFFLIWRSLMMNVFKKRYLFDLYCVRCFFSVLRFIYLNFKLWGWLGYVEGRLILISCYIKVVGRGLCYYRFRCYL